jgi:hypothetical protein
MILYLVIIQVFYLLTLFPWFVIWGLSTMAFDAGISAWGISLMTIVSLYPIAVIACSILSWVFRKKWRSLNIYIISAIPLLWVFAFGTIIIAH